MRNILLQLNIADDYFKMKKQLKQSESDSDLKSGEIFDLKHEIIMLQTRLEAAENEIIGLQKENLEEQKKVVRLETELIEARKNKTN